MTPRIDVPCNGCVACCRSDALRIQPHEDVTRWRTEPHPTIPSARMLAHKANGDCVYIGRLANGREGCTIHGDTPEMCGELDCRMVYERIPFSQALAMHKRRIIKLAVWRQGQKLSRETR